MSLPIAIQVYSVRGDASADLRGTLEKIKEMGYDGVELAGMYGHTPEEIRDMCKEIGLNPISAHVGFNDLMNDTENLVSQYATIGCKYIAIPNVPGEYRPGNEKFEESLTIIPKIGEVCNKHGIILLYHNHDFEFAKVNGEYGLDILYSTVPANLLKCEIDTCWVKVSGENPADYIKKYAGRIPVVHLKDFWGEKSEDMYELIGIANKPAPKRPDGFEFRPVGKGLQDFPSICAASVESGAEWLIVEQDKASMGLTALECAKASRDYLKSIGF